MKLLRSKALWISATALVIFAIFLSMFMPDRRTLDCFGSIRSPKINAKLIFSDSDPGIKVERRESGFDIGIVSYGVTHSVSPETWINHEGFFAFVDNEGRFWAYNGKDQTWIYERLPDGGARTWGLPGYNGKIPEEFALRVPASFTKQKR